jgi:putative NADH-flavin reductase
MKNDIAIKSQDAGRSETRGMKLVVLGATGGTGLEIVKKATEHNHSVTAFVRSPQRLKLFQDRISIVRGDLLNSVELAQVIQGHDAVVSGFGPRIPVSKADANLLHQFAIALTRAMLRAEVRHVVVESVAFLFKDAIFPPAYLLGKSLFPGIVADSAAMEDVFQQSGLDWTIVRPPQLTDGPYTGNYRVREGHLPRFGFKITRADVADFMIKAAGNPSLIRKIVGISN